MSTVTRESYYVGFRVGDQESGLDPNGHNHGMTSPVVGYQPVDDVAASLRQAADAGWRTQQDVKDVAEEDWPPSLRTPTATSSGSSRPAETSGRRTPGRHRAGREHDD